MSIAVYPGSFDPLTHGHIDVIKRVSRLFDKVIVLVAYSSKKQYLFSAEERKSLIASSIKEVKNIEVQIHDGLTIDFVNSVGSKVIIRGVRSSNDFDNEIVVAQMNRKLAPEIETLVLFPNAEYQFIASSAIKEVAQSGGHLEAFVPKVVAQALKEKFHVVRKN